IGEVAHGAERDVDFAVQVVVAILNNAFEHTNNLVGNAVNPHLFAQRVRAREQLLLDVGAEHGHAAVRVFVELGEEGAIFHVHAPHVRIVRINSADPVTAAPRAIGDGALLGGFGRDALEQRHLGLKVIEIVDGKFDFAASLGAARLQGGASGEDEDQVRAPGAESDPQAPLETGAVGEQQHDGRDAPSHAEHSKYAAAAIVLERAVGLAGEFENHSYSVRRRWSAGRPRPAAELLDGRDTRPSTVYSLLLLAQSLHRLQQRGLARRIKSRGDAGNRQRKN